MTMRRKILIVEEQKINRDILCNLLCRKYDLLLADCAEQAMEVLRKDWRYISVVILDFAMPNRGGYTLLKTIQRDAVLAKVPVIVSTPKDCEEGQKQAFVLGACDFFVKPYQPEIVRQRIANVIKLHETAAFINAIEKDDMTGVLSKQFFMRRASKMISQHPDGTYDVICGDIEHFELVNEIFGVKNSNGLLHHVAECISQRCDNVGGVCGRYGADEFVMIMPHHKYSNDYFELLLADVNRFPMGMSIVIRFGIVPCITQDVPIETLCDRALLASQDIRGKYGRYFNMYNDKIRQKMLEEQLITDSMQTALQQHQFLVYYQPKYGLQHGEIAGAEALVRWQHPQYGFMSPDRFIPLFERNGFIVALDQYVWEVVCRDMRAWLDQGYPEVPISVNVSRTDLYMEDLPEILANLVHKYGLHPQQLHLEITESVYTEDSEKIVQVVQKLKSGGFIVEMDDFGKGYSSLNMLNELPIDVLKLDMRFLQSKKKNSIVGFIIRLARQLHLKVIAEGVETEEQVEMLQNIGCHYAQGYFYAKPLSKEDFLGRLREKKAQDPATYEEMKYVLEVSNTDDAYFGKLLLDPAIEKRLDSSSSWTDSHLLQARQGKKEVLSRVRNAIRMPLSVMLGMAAIAREQEELSTQVSDCIDTIYITGEYLLHLFDDVVENEFVENNRLALQKAAVGETVDLNHGKSEKRFGTIPIHATGERPKKEGWNPKSQWEVKSSF